MSFLDDLRLRLAVVETRIARLEAGTHPDLPDDLELRAAVLRSSRIARDSLHKVIAETIPLVGLTAEDLL